MAALITREEHQRRMRRRRRQFLGLVVVVMVFLGALHLVDTAVGLYQRVTDPTEKMKEYENLLRSVVMYDPAYFDGLENVSDSFIKETSVWGTIYELIEKGQWETLERSDDERAILPGVDVSAFCAKLYGPSVQLTHSTFTDDFGLEYVYDESRQGYLIPVTSTENSYSPTVVQLQNKDGKLRVSVGYISNVSDGITQGVTQSKPQKYADYIFERGLDRKWYLTGIQESQWKAEEGDVIHQETTADLVYDPAGALQQQMTEDSTLDQEN